MNTIELEHWTPDPEDPRRLKYIGQPAAQEVFEELRHRLESMGYLPDEYFILDNQWEKGRKIPKDADIFCVTDYGASEGIYIDVYLKWNEDGKPVTKSFITGKTLGESGSDLDRMFLIASAITKAFRGGDFRKNSVLSLNEQEQAIVVNALTEQRERQESALNQTEQLLRRMTGSITAYMDVVGERPLRICQYKDIPIIQELVRQLRRSGAFANKSCGLHVHVSSAPFDARTLRNLTNIMYSKEDILYRALQVEVARENRYCQKTDPLFIDEPNQRRPKSMEELSRIWYQGDSRSKAHYDESRYRGVNLHSVFQKGTIEFRLYNSTVEHTGKIKAYIQLSLAITAQALNQHSASRIKTVSENERYTFRTWLLRMGLIGDEFATARKHLLENLDGNIAWRDPAQAQRQKERMQAMREQEHAPVPDFSYEQTEDEEQDSGPVMSM